MQLNEQQRELAAKYIYLIPWARKKYPRYLSQLGADEFDSVVGLSITLSARDFDPSRGVQFSTFAINSLWWRLKRAVENVRERPADLLPLSVEPTDIDNFIEWDQLSGLREADREILRDKFLSRMNNVELGAARGVGRERARQLIARAIANAKRLLCR